MAEVKEVVDFGGANTGSKAHYTQKESLFRAAVVLQTL